MYRNIQVAILARVFEGLATDNLLHYALSAIYVSTVDKSRFPRLMGYSMALFMLGMSASPTIAGLLPGLYASFIMALSLFSFSLLYLCILVPVIKVEECSIEGHLASCSLYQHGAEEQGWLSYASRFFQPFIDTYKQIPVAITGVSLLLLNTTQAYLFPALMVYTSTKFSFTNTQNGYLVSIAATVSALYLITVYYIKPHLDRLWQQLSRVRGDSPLLRPNTRLDTDPSETQADTTREIDTAESTTDPPASFSTASRADFRRAIMCLSIQVVILPCIALATEAWQMYVVASTSALGLAAPSFIKSYAVSLAENKSAAVASLAIMESVGGLLSTLVIGMVQSWTGGGTVFMVASGIVSGSLLAIIATRFVRQSQ